MCLLAGRELRIDRAADHARVQRLGVADAPGFLQIVLADTEVRYCGKGGDFPLDLLLASTITAMSGDLAPLLRRIVLVREPALRLRLDLQGIRLGAVCRRDWKYAA